MSLFSVFCSSVQKSYIGVMETNMKRQLVCMTDVVGVYGKGYLCSNSAFFTMTGKPWTCSKNKLLTTTFVRSALTSWGFKNLSIAPGIWRNGSSTTIMADFTKDGPSVAYTVAVQIESRFCSVSSRSIVHDHQQNITKQQMNIPWMLRVRGMFVFIA